MESGAIVPSEAHGLWAGWAAPGSPLRRGAMAAEQAYQVTQAQDPDDELPDDELPLVDSDRPQGGAMAKVVMLLIGAAVGAALMYALGR